MLKIRLRRIGRRHRPFYRIVVVDSRRSARTPGLEEIGYYDPRARPRLLKIDLERYQHWVSRGAQVSATVARLAKEAKKSPAEAPSWRAERFFAKAIKAEEPKAEAPSAEEAAAEEAAAASDEPGEYAVIDTIPPPEDIFGDDDA